jgi:uncharacterized membrane protein (DUF106 family)
MSKISNTRRNSMDLNAYFGMLQYVLMGATAIAILLIFLYVYHSRNDEEEEKE